jgi:hypothetical protein
MAKFGELVHVGHLDALGRTGVDAETAVAALGNVDVELRDIEPLLRSDGREAEIDVGGRFDGLDRDAVDGTGHGALVTPDAIVHVHVQPVARPLGELQLDVRILDRHRGRKQVPPGDLHPDQDGHHAVPDIPEICQA